MKKKSCILWKGMMRNILLFGSITLLFGLQDVARSEAHEHAATKVQASIYYHATLKRNLAEILQGGLDPNFGGTGASNNHNRFQKKSLKKIHLTDSLLIANFYGDILACREDESPVILEIKLQPAQKLRLEKVPDEHRAFTTSDKIDPSAIKQIETETRFSCFYKKISMSENQASLDQILSGTSTLYFGYSRGDAEVTKNLSLLDGMFLSPNWRVSSRDCLLYDADGKETELDSMYMGKVQLTHDLKEYKVTVGSGPQDDEDQVVDDGSFDFIFYNERGRFFEVYKKALSKLKITAFEKIPCKHGTGARPPQEIHTNKDEL